MPFTFVPALTTADEPLTYKSLPTETLSVSVSSLPWTSHTTRAAGRPRPWQAFMAMISYGCRTRVLHAATVRKPATASAL